MRVTIKTWPPRLSIKLETPIKESFQRGRDEALRKRMLDRMEQVPPTSQPTGINVTFPQGNKVKVELIDRPTKEQMLSGAALLVNLAQRDVSPAMQQLEDFVQANRLIIQLEGNRRQDSWAYLEAQDGKEVRYFDPEEHPETAHSEYGLGPTQELALADLARKISQRQILISGKRGRPKTMKVPELI